MWIGTCLCGICPPRRPAERPLGIPSSPAAGSLRPLNSFVTCHWRVHDVSIDEESVSKAPGVAGLGGADGSESMRAVSHEAPQRAQYRGSSLVIPTNPTRSNCMRDVLRRVCNESQTRPNRMDRPMTCRAPFRRWPLVLCLCPPGLRLYWKSSCGQLGFIIAPESSDWRVAWTKLASPGCGSGECARLGGLRTTLGLSARRR